MGWTVYEQTYDLPGILQKIQGARDELVLYLAKEDNTPWYRSAFDEIMSTTFHRFGNQIAETLLEGKVQYHKEESRHEESDKQNQESC